MTCPKDQKLPDFRADYTSPLDFCKLLEQELKPLYLLAFLLTANREKAEQCFAATVEQAMEEHTVVKEWARSWIKRCLIRNAVAMVFHTSDDSIEDREFWSATQYTAAGVDSEIDAVTQLPALERCVFIMSILERYSDCECSVLLGRSAKNVAEARMRALRRLPGPVALAPGGEPSDLRFVDIPA